MTGMTGLELQSLLKSKGIKLPVVVVTAFADVPTAVHAMKAGAVGFLEKPWRGEELWSSIKTGLDIAGSANTIRSAKPKSNSGWLSYPPMNCSC